MAYLYLMVSIICELIGTSLVKASEGFTRVLPVLGVFASFSFAFFFLSLSLKIIPLNVAYAIWSGLGTVATVIISVLIWKEKINIASVIGIVLIITGVIVLNLWSPSQNTLQNSDRTEVVQSELRL